MIVIYSSSYSVGRSISSLKILSTFIKIICKCRKPKKGMIEKAIKELNIKNKNFFFIGDSSLDHKVEIKYN